jgi:hypothetical protein
MYRRIFSIIRTSDPEIVDCYNTNDPQDKYAAISQKQALLLVLHYLKYVIHSTKDSKFGMLTYDEDVRWYMQRDVALTREVADITAKASRYQMHIVTKNFICSETETFPDPVPESPLLLGCQGTGRQGRAEFVFHCLGSAHQRLGQNDKAIELYRQQVEFVSL